MMRAPPVLLLTCILALCGHRSYARRRNLTEITYHFTNCGSTNHDGPRVTQQCLPLYAQMNSPIANPGTLFQFEDFDGEYDGAQGFRLPRDDLYNITIAGARGGEGVCNYHYGYGTVISAQVRLTTDYEYLILVGHKGTSVCNGKKNANHLLCQQPRPINLAETQACNDSWYNWTAFNTSAFNQHNRYHFNGGGGGGGASMIWPRRVENKQFTGVPIMISSGGGGASAILDYTVAGVIVHSPINLTYPLTNSDETIYDYHTNGHLFQYALGWAQAIRGFRHSGPHLVTSGAGSGWIPSIEFELSSIDGKLLSRGLSFAEGGFDCSSRLEEINSNVFTDVFGGFGGGGGGCGSGGGGGGLTGGHVIGNSNTIPGSGGDAGVFEHPELPVINVPSQFFYNDGDGYVEIVASDCGCVGECAVYNETEEFECLCPNSTILAPDLSDCFEEIDIAIKQEGLTPLEENLRYREVSMNASVQLFSFSTTVNVEPVRVSKRQTSSQLQANQCLLVLYGDGAETVLVSNVVSDSGVIDALSVTALNSNGTITKMSNLTSMLKSSVLVTGMILLSTGDCRLAGSTIQANVSIQPVSTSTANASRILDILDDIANSIFKGDVTSSTPEVATIVGAVIGSTLGVTMVIIIIVVALGVCYYRSHTQRHELNESKTLNQLYVEKNNYSDGESMEVNTGYIQYQVAPSAPVLNDGYDTIQVGESEEVQLDSSRLSTQFNPLYGIRAPEVDFSNFNRQRVNTGTKNWSYPRSKLTYMRELGEGQFGKVLLMQATDIAGYRGTIPVAVKTLTSRDPEVIKKFKEEAELMKKFSHPNVVGLLGFIEGDGSDSAPLMILEYMQYGDLHGFLVKNRPSFKNPSQLNDFHFHLFAYDIAKGLELLSRHRHVHRDIAARNCLVGSGLQIKIADFGLARGISSKDYYKVVGSAVLPVRWMAPENLLLGKFTTASDVWSYGVLIWEILTFGQQPLPDMDTEEIIEAARTKRLEHERPENAPEDLYQLMCSCHQQHMEDRPSFEEIVGMDMFEGVKKRPPLLSSESVDIDEH